jgi:hypothetical protein
MAKAIPFYWFEREDYDLVRRLIPNDRHLPGSFDQWERNATKEIAQLEARGISVRKVMVDPREYAAYCGARGMGHSIATLGRFVVDASKEE